ncbi:MAG: hypothetical protein Kow0097_12220 [Candidatus Bipolaricaulota bacterium]
MLESEIRVRSRAIRTGILLVVVGSVLIGGMSALAASKGALSVAPLYTENVPKEGLPTVYGLPLAWTNAQLFATWYDTLRLTATEAEILGAALAPLTAPCCDDNPLARCCCERGGLICNVVRTARGLGAYLVQAGYAPEVVTAAMEQWLRFIHGDYYVARALADQGVDPRAYGLFQPGNGACYRGLCTAPLQEGGCGGMGHEVIVERPRI